MTTIESAALAFLAEHGDDVLAAIRDNPELADVADDLELLLLASDIDGLMGDA